MRKLSAAGLYSDAQSLGAGIGGGTFGRFDPMPVIEPEDCFPEYAPDEGVSMYEKLTYEFEDIDTNAADKDAPTFAEYMKMATTEELLSEREQTHGDFSVNSWVSQGLKEVILQHEGSYGNRLTRLHRDALDMIFAKIGRIVAGNPNFVDHWDDIAGYARLVSQRV